MTNNQNIGFIGAGNMASAMIGGIINNNFPNKQLGVFDPKAESAEQLHKEFGIQVYASNEALIAQCDVVVIALKPQIMQTVLDKLQTAFANKKPLIISIAAGIPCEHINNWLNHQHAIVRVMPNTPALVNAGASGLFANKLVSEEQKTVTESLLNAIGKSSWVELEDHIDAVTALSGSGPAYFMLFTKALINAGINAGLSENAAKKLALQTCEGSALLMRESNESIEQLIKNVTSPNGTTEQALNSFAENNLEEVVKKAFEAAFYRSKELANELK